MAQPTFKFTKESLDDFDRTLKAYLKRSSRTLPEALNEKAYFILNGGPDTQGAIRLTHKASADRIKSDLGARTVQQVGKRGKLIKKFRTEIADKYWNQLAVKLVIAKLRKAGKSIPAAAELRAMAVKLVNVRLASIGFIRSGWLPALRRLARFSKYGRIKFADTGKKVGVNKGGVTIATEKSPRVIFWNSAAGESKHKGALMKYAAPALQQAFNDETRSMKAYLERKLRESAHAVGIRTN